jgi:hypothetical protein
VTAQRYPLEADSSFTGQIQERLYCCLTLFGMVHMFTARAEGMARAEIDGSASGQ